MQTTKNNREEPFPLGKTYRIFIGGEWSDADEEVEIRFPYDRSVLVGRVAWAQRRHVDAALELAWRGAQEMASWPLHRRAALLHRVANLIAAREEHFAWLILHEVGKPI